MSFRFFTGDAGGGGHIRGGIWFYRSLPVLARVVTREGMEIHFTPDPAKTLRVNNIHATLCGCLFTHRRKKSVVFHVRSASSGHFMPNTRRCVLRSFG